MLRPGKPIVKIVLLAVLVLSTAALILISSAIRQSEEARERARQAAIAQEQENQKYQDLNDKAGTEEGYKDAAGDMFDMVPGDNVEFVGQENS